MRDCFTGLKAVIFDFDGTLAETNIDFGKMRQRIYDLVREWGLWEDAMGEGRYVLEVIEEAKSKLALPPASDPERAAEFGRAAERVLIEVEMETVGFGAPYAGVPEALQTLLDHGYRIGIITRNARECIDHFLARHPLPHEVCLTREEVDLVKPHPRHLLAALEKMGLQPGDVVMVGDHRSDIECALAAGAHCAGVYLTGATKEEFEALGADASYENVPAFVRELCLGE